MRDVVTALFYTSVQVDSSHSHMARCASTLKMKC